MPEKAAVLRCLIGGYLAPGELQYKTGLAAATAAAAASAGQAGGHHEREQHPWRMTGWPRPATWPPGRCGAHPLVRPKPDAASTHVTREEF
jgi:hypothetical protein